MSKYELDFEIETLGTPDNIKFKINDALIIYNFEDGDNGFTYSIDYDDQKLSEEEAKRLADRAIQHFIHVGIEKAKEMENSQAKPEQN